MATRTIERAPNPKNTAAKLNALLQTWKFPRDAAERAADALHVQLDLKQQGTALHAGVLEDLARMQGFSAEQCGQVAKALQQIVPVVKVTGTLAQEEIERQRLPYAERVKARLRDQTTQQLKHTRESARQSKGNHPFADLFSKDLVQSIADRQATQDARRVLSKRVKQ